MGQNLELFTADGQRKYLTPEERQSFIVAAKTHPEREARTLCLTVAHSGCRISEALQLTYHRIDQKAGQLVFRSLKKRNGEVHHRAVPVPPDLLEALELVHGVRAIKKQRRKRNQLVWDVSRTTGWRRIAEVMKLAGIEGAHASPKGLRHAFGVQALIKDIPLPLLQRWMGHADLETTAIYLQVVGNEEASFAGRMWEDA